MTWTKIIATGLATALAAGALTFTTNGEAPPAMTEPPLTPTLTEEAASTIPELLAAPDTLWHGHTARWWAWQARASQHHAQRLERRLKVKWQPTVLYAIRLASVVYGVPYRDLLTVARCESGLNPYSRNPNSTASGLFQFLHPSTWYGDWGAKPFADAGFSVWDPVANALAAAYVVNKDGGFGQWVCKPR